MEDLLPYPVVYRKKEGMGVPLNHWFANTALKDFANDALTEKRIKDRGLFDFNLVKTILQGQMPPTAIGQNRSGELAWMLLILELWFQLFIDNQALNFTNGKSS